MEGPGARMVAAAAVTMMVQDADGRELLVRRMTALDRLRLFKAIGAELSQNSAYLGMAMLAASVTSIDGVPVPAPANERNVEALILRLGDSGISAVAGELAANHPPVLGSAEQGN